MFRSAKRADAGTDAMRETINLAGHFVQRFATVELLVAAWLCKIEASPDTGAAFLKKNRTLHARMERLRELLNAGGERNAQSLVDALAQIEPLRKFRNQFLHSAVGLDEQDETVLVGSQGIMSMTVAVVDAHIDSALAVLNVLNDGYIARYGDHPSLQLVAMNTPPPVE
ncbi:MAG: hypothetical protein AAB403_12875 [Planctomycetota bacterium]